MCLDADPFGISPGDLTSGVSSPGDFSAGGERFYNEASFSPAASRQVSHGLSMNRNSTAPLAGTYEVKFVIDEQKGDAIREWARQHLLPDPHSSAEVGYGYWVNSLYLDTPGFDVYRRGDGFRQRKYRLRRYGSESGVWMELKRKHDGQVRKRRIHVTDAELLSRLSLAPDEGWEGYWFQQRLHALKLRPVSQVTYRRFACVGQSSTGSIRLTIDSQLSSSLATRWEVPTQPLTSGQLLAGQQILELKFRDTVPALFRGLIEDHRLTLGSFSKYRHSVEACIPMQQLIGDSGSGKTAN